MSLFHLQTKIGRHILRDNKEYLYFSGTDYLGMAAAKEYEDLVIRGIKNLGLNHGLSRINNVRLNIFDQFENYFAEKAGADKALVWSSGYLAGYGTVNYLLDHTDYIFIAPDTHPAILPEELSPEPNQSFEEWTTHVKELCETLKAQRILILANAVDPLKPSIHDFSWIGHLPRKHQYTFLVDDSHAFGVIGEDIYGTYNRWKFLPVELLVSGSLGKGLGIPAGITLGPVQQLIGILNRKIFRSASPPPQAYLWAFLQAQDLYKEQFQKLQKNKVYFNSAINQISGFEKDLGFPVYTFTNRKWVGQLEEEGIIISSFPYPEPTDPWINRIVLSAHHEQEDLEKLYTILEKIQGQVLNSKVLT
ncbi:MAG: aminotransferase class I/II-fold pyridoxal phosphate-dependent enzyme [Mongoliibacter sp.]|uniref:aminotransferase class I/II-fold pyridoxal phosphate-dependent enzyme n=1 Tax=Mongoliibacter sp. TaxID=2022438 RepID=UPI0012EF7894|nr:aminotransferase class I/II-fold pyridoxal phosphate-dependent enzyme [Mongoliibacter sp.]TVP51743.1 MAG: aminotransferase class I/II-fold pyridoxal phosphate-dependent enzyme [Mongoliibacter sp.]